MKINRATQKPTKMRRITEAALLMACAQSAFAGSTIDLGNDITFDYAGTINYGVGMRTESPSSAIINGPIGPSGLPTTINGDDGDRNFKKDSLITNRVSARLEGSLKYQNFGFVMRGDMFYDDVYNTLNDNNSPGTVNKSGPYNQFTQGARDYDGQRVRLLDAYGYGDFNLGDTKLNIRAGQQVVQWGESLYFANIAGAQAPADATKVNLPGAEVKDILLPTGQISGQWAINNKVSLLGYYQYQYKATEQSPAGDYFSTADMIGPGADRIYTLANPLLAYPGGAALPGLPTALTATRGPDIMPKNTGQWGIGTRFRLDEKTEYGLYFLNYDDKNPSVVTNFGIATLYPGNGVIPPITSAALPAAYQNLPISYQIKYFSNIKLAGATFSTELGGYNVAGEISLRDGAPVLVNAPAGATATRSKSWQGNLSAIKLVEKTPIADSMTLTAEVSVHQVLSVDAVDLGGAQYNQLSNTKSSWAYTLAWTPSYNNVFSGWDLDVPVTFQQVVNGTPAVAGSFGSLTGKGDMRLSAGVTFKYLSNLEMSLAYNAYMGGANAITRPLADRNYVAFNAKYSF